MVYGNYKSSHTPLYITKFKRSPPETEGRKETMAWRKGNKYNNTRAVLNGVQFDSKRELNRYTELKLLEKAGIIKDLRRQVKFQLLPSQKSKDGSYVLERAVHYIADFTYMDEQGNMIVEDTKGVKTPDYIIKRKLMLYMNGIEIKEI